jgi:transcriptional regulator with XRE-family HTH domain
MNPAATIREARRQAGLTQSELAAKAGTSQAALSAYENGRKQPSLETFGRILEAAGARLTVEMQLERTARRFSRVLDLAAALPTKHSRTLSYPRLR